MAAASASSSYEAVQQVDAQVQADLARLQGLYARWRALRASARAADADVAAAAAELAEARTALAAARARREQALVARLGPFDDGGGADVHLVVGGRAFCVERAALCCDKGSALAALCRAGGPPAAGGPGSGADCPLYLDRDPYTFEQVLAFLRSGSLPPAHEAAALRALYVESAHLVLVSLRDAIEDQLLDDEGGEDDSGGDNLGEEVGETGEGAQAQALAAPPVLLRAPQLPQGSDITSRSLVSQSSAPATPKRGSVEVSMQSPKAEALLSAAVAITRAKEVGDSFEASLRQSDDTVLLASSVRSPLRFTGAGAGAGAATPSRSSASLSLIAPPGPMSPAASALRRALGEMELDMLREPLAPPRASESVAPPAPPPPPSVLTTADYVGGAWRAFYALPVTPAATPVAEADVGVAAATSAADVAPSLSLLQRAAASRLPDPFGFGRR